MNHVYADYYAEISNSTQLAAHRRKNGIVLLPVGCFEMRSPQTSLAYDSFAAEAACCVLAEEWGARILPPIHYTYPGVTSAWPGTIAISPEATVAYVREVLLAVLKNGFNRVIAVSLNAPNAPLLEMVIRCIFQETGKTPVYYSPDCGEFYHRVEARWGTPQGEAMLLLASLYILGRHGEWDPAQTGPGTGDQSRTTAPSASALRTHGVSFCHPFLKPEIYFDPYGLDRHRPDDSLGGTSPGLTLDDARAGADLYKEVILTTARGLPDDYEVYQRVVQRSLEEGPWKDL